MRYASIDIETLGLCATTCDTIEFGCVLDDLSDRKPLEELPRFHCYVTRPNDLYRGEAYAMSMHPVILKRIANREEGYSYVPWDLLDEVFAEWLVDQDITEKLVVAGKNFQAFDMRFLRAMQFGRRTQIHHRTLDPGSMWFDPKLDVSPPSLEVCLSRATGKGRTPVSHTAIEDALDVILCVRNRYSEEEK